MKEEKHIVDKTDCELIICGDICPTRDTWNSFETGNAETLFSNLLPLLKQADLTVANIEFAITDTDKGIQKCGPILLGKPSCIDLLKNAGIQIAGLANNHIRDGGEDGVLNTLACCSDAGIKTVGAGANLSAAKLPLIVEAKGWKVGFFAFGEQEFNTADGMRAGANYLDLYSDFDAIRELRNQVDYLIILYHGGIEYYRYPSPGLQKKCRKMIHSGADLVICQHSHCIGTREIDGEGTILYGQGNTVFGYRENNASWNQGLIVKVNLCKDRFPAITYLPVSATPLGIQLLEWGEAEEVLRPFYTDSRQLQDALFIRQSWQEFCEKAEALYLPLLYGRSRYFTFINRKLKNLLFSLLYSQHALNVTHNLIRCESHREVVETILNKKVYR